MIRNVLCVSVFHQAVAYKSILTSQLRLSTVYSVVIVVVVGNVEVLLQFLNNVGSQPPYILLPTRQVGLRSDVHACV